MSQAITASRLNDGAVVFLGADATWTERLDGARLFGTKDDAAIGLEAAKRDEGRNLVVDVYAIDISTKGGGAVPTKLRELIRARGPSVHPEHAKPGSFPATAPEDDHVSV